MVADQNPNYVGNDAVGNSKRSMPDTTPRSMSEHGTSDFVKKLYLVVDDRESQDVVSWGPEGDLFIVKDVNRFSNSVLPRIYKHSNFASFVRQLNKYGFHKIKTIDEDSGTCAFRHADFHRDGRDALENIKRKSQRTISVSTASNPPAASSPQQLETQNKIVSLELQLTTLGAIHLSVLTSLRTLERSNHEVILKIIGFQRNLAQQDGVLCALLKHLRRDRIGTGASKMNQLPVNESSGSDRGNSSHMFLEAQETQQMLGQGRPESDVARATLQQMSELSRQVTRENLSDLEDEMVLPTPTKLPISDPHSPHADSTFVPGWAVPPRILLVDDDAVTRKLSSKFLKIFGCTTDVAVDGVSAVSKMNLEKYDLILMDILMPKMDGITATLMIRKFDPQTPIISMTSSSRPAEIMRYFSSGMNDILPKPFTRDGLLDMLEKHLSHLTVIKQQMATFMIPYPPTAPPPNEIEFGNAFTTGAVSSLDNALNYGLGNPQLGDGQTIMLAGIGITDEEYNRLLMEILGGGDGSTFESTKRQRDADEENERGGKRNRFEVLAA
ncbi:hypothetical protein B0H16DRAFT_1559474 [Mycena metata]|uniref:Response regulatory domain-containing protein n=1 Tax=Mycena metata TaxID=1033252 RepID=A0AAD7N475_9AGAR|nr:hypothetical protein B0H16DRAFT_1559474 [Mycena metata]